jgi:hypothetical protein
MLYLTIVLGILVILLSVVTYNLLQKVEKLEDVIVRSDDFYIKFKNKIEYASEKLTEIDHNGAFQSDDEIGWYFTTLKEVHEGIQEYVDTTYAQTFQEK